jgi:uncharacterized membrane protein
MAKIYSNQLTVSIQTGQAKYDLHVVVENMSGEVIAGALVSVDSQVKTTNSDGYVDFYLTPGSYTVTARASGYRPASKTIDLEGNYLLIIQLQYGLPRPL